MAHKTQRAELTPVGQHSETLQEIARQIAEVDPQSAALERQDAAAREAVANFDGVSPSTSDEELVANRIFEALPAGLALCSGSEILRANDAFALAFGYQNLGELRTAGGLEEIFPDQIEFFKTTPQSPVESPPQRAIFDARTRSRRRIAIPLAIHSIVMQQGKLIRLLTLHPQQAAEPDQIRTATQAAEQQEEHQPPVENIGDAQESALPDTKEEISEVPATQTAKPEAWEADFLAKISHGVRTPLNSIIGFAELMREERLGPIGNDRYKSYIGDIHDSGRYALSVINDLLDISRIEAGQFELNFTSVDVNEVIASCNHTMQAEAHQNRVFLRMSLAENLTPVLADRASVRQILFNLLINAIKFTNPGGQVVVSTREQPTGEVRIRVRDNGVGLSKDDITQTMHPYRQPDTAPRKLVGTGLALPLTRALTQANRAKFNLQSEPASGTCVDIIFPANRTLTR